MKTKEAIEYMENLNKAFPCFYGYIHNSGINDVIALLQRGEKYRQIWEEIAFQRLSTDTIEYYVKKYLPDKEVKNETHNKRVKDNSKEKFA